LPIEPIRESAFGCRPCFAARAYNSFAFAPSCIRRAVAVADHFRRQELTVTVVDTGAEIAQCSEKAVALFASMRAC
jgi:hypothetical protein